MIEMMVRIPPLMGIIHVDDAAPVMATLAFFVLQQRLAVRRQIALDAPGRIAWPRRKKWRRLSAD
ncbi:MAG: hypothetical protein U1F31_10655 [Steroidobacteraceae bacterium]